MQTITFVCPLLLLGIVATAWSQPKSVIVGNVRVQAISPTLLRLEVKGPKGFEDRPTFHVLDRQGTGVELSMQAGDAETTVRGPNFVIDLPKDASSLSDVAVTTLDGQPLAAFHELPPNNPWLPDPASHPAAWAFADTPRLARSDTADAPKTGNVGWDPSNDSTDVYVFLPKGDYRTLRTDFLKLTGPTEMMPLYAFGAWDSRWFEYTEQSALQQVEDYRSRQIPLDVLVVDTDWRNGGSHGYDVNTKDFPDLKRFFEAAHDKHVRVMFNDHPEPVSKSALDPAELKYRTENLTRLLNDGLDIWWYDRNWSTHLGTPMPGLRLEAWGIELYHDVTAAVRPNRRPLIMANVVGIDNGIRHVAPDVATHRYPTQWTGDIKPTYDTLAGSVMNAVHAGVANCFAYESDDLGGHVADPSPEAFIRWIEFGSLSPVYRPHCTKDLKRMPWAFGEEAEKIARNYVQLRYRLLPTLYAAAHENFISGEPILRRLDLEFPDQPDAKREDQYLLGHDLLVAPITQGVSAAPLPNGLLKTVDDKLGLSAEYFDNDQLRGEPKLRRIDPSVNFDWGSGSPDPSLPNDHFSARWTGKIGPVPGKDGEHYTLSATSDDGVRLWLNGQLVIDRWIGQDRVTTAASLPLEAGKTYDLKIEYNDLNFDASFGLSLSRVGGPAVEQSRAVWIPPGDWINLWNGQTVTGPRAIDVGASLHQIPLFVRAGSMILLGQDMQYTAEKPWDWITLDLYPSSARPSETALYEDDGDSIAYQSGGFRTTQIHASASDASGTIRVQIDPTNGTFEHALSSRGWKIRVHPLDGRSCNSATVAGKAIDTKRLAKQSDAMPLSHGGVPDADVTEVTLPAANVDAAHDITLRFANRE